MRLFGPMQEAYDELWKAIIRPPRDRYDPADLGPSVFHIGGRIFRRTDLELLNGRNQRLLCSHFEPSPECRSAAQIPCIVYLHGNCSSRLEALSALPLILSLNCSLFCFDFAGSGLSDGEYVSLGFYEREDLAAVVDYLRSIDTVSGIGVWGRSMGAATALLHGPRDPAIAGMVLDSPFSDLRQLADELVYHFVSAKIPKFLVGWGLSFVRSSIKTRANFDINELSPITCVDQTYIPALFAAADQDSFIRPDHAKLLHDKYAGDKNLVLVPGEHNSPRPRFFLDSVAIFFINTLRISEVAARGVGDLRPPAFLRPRGIRGINQRPDDARRREDHDLALQQAIQVSIEDTNSSK
jgi:pimeloyl-ACP methyl ester carboxylesterase